MLAYLQLPSQNWIRTELRRPDVITNNAQTKQAARQFRRLKQLLASHRFHNTEKVEITNREWLRKQKPDFHRDGIFKLVPRLDKRVSVFGDCPENCYCRGEKGGAAFGTIMACRLILIT
jgi:hypothetical protein